MGGKLQFVEHCKSEQEPNYTYTNYLANEKIYIYGNCVVVVVFCIDLTMTLTLFRLVELTILMF